MGEGRLACDSGRPCSQRAAAAASVGSSLRYTLAPVPGHIHSPPLITLITAHILAIALYPLLITPIAPYLRPLQAYKAQVVCAFLLLPSHTPPPTPLSTMTLRGALRYFAPRTGGVSNTLRAASTAAAAAPAPPAAEPEALPSMDEMRTKARRVYKEVCSLRRPGEADNSSTASAVTSESSSCLLPVGWRTDCATLLDREARSDAALRHTASSAANPSPDPEYNFNMRLRRAFESASQLDRVAQKLTAENAKITDPAKLKQQLDLAEHIKKGEWPWVPCRGRGGEALRCYAVALLLYCCMPIADPAAAPSVLGDRDGQCPAPKFSPAWGAGSSGGGVWGCT